MPLAPTVRVDYSDTDTTGDTTVITESPDTATVPEQNTTDQFIRSDTPFGPLFKAPALPEGSEYYRGMPPLHEIVSHYNPEDPVVLHALNTHKALKAEQRKRAEAEKLMHTIKRDLEDFKANIVANTQKQLTELPAEPPKWDPWADNADEQMDKVIAYRQQKLALEATKPLVTEHTRIAHERKIEDFVSARPEFQDASFQAIMDSVIDAETQAVAKDPTYRKLSIEQAHRIAKAEWLMSKQQESTSPSNDERSPFLPRSRHDASIQQANQLLEQRESARATSSGKRVDTVPNILDMDWDDQKVAIEKWCLANPGKQFPI